MLHLIQQSVEAHGVVRRRDKGVRKNAFFCCPFHFSVRNKIKGMHLWLAKFS